jgi:hypothetical protein
LPTGRHEGEFRFHPQFRPEFAQFPLEVRRIFDETVLAIKMAGGPAVGRPHVDTLKGSRHANMKELRFDAEDGVWRFAFAYDPSRNATVLCGGGKQGVNQKLFYKRLIATADERYDTHLAVLLAAKAKAGAESKVKVAQPGYGKGGGK